MPIAPIKLAVNTNNSAAESPEVKLLLSKMPLPEQRGDTGAEARLFKIPPREFFAQCAGILNLPKDPVSVNLLAFARFFSLSPALLPGLRREILSAIPGGLTEPEMEAEVFARLAAFDKGVNLNSRMQAHYARLLISQYSGGGSGSGGGNNKDQDRKEMPDAEELKVIVEEESKKDGFLDLFNSLPGKNGQYWLVCPFNIKVNGVELNVVVRILSNGNTGAHRIETSGEYLIADINGPRRQWRCILTGSSGKIRLKMQVYPVLSVKGLAFLQKEAEQRLISVFEEISVSNRNEVSSWVDDLFTDFIPVINEEV